MSLCAFLFSFKDRRISFQEAAMKPIFARSLCAFFFGYKDRCISLEVAAVMHIFLQWIYVQQFCLVSKTRAFFSCYCVCLSVANKKFSNHRSCYVCVAAEARLWLQLHPGSSEKIPPITPGRMWRRRRDKKQEMQSF
jgi:hypothetical protein